jgi:replicative DNA helicase
LEEEVVLVELDRTVSQNLPQSAETERAVLAAVLLDPQRLPAVAQRLRVEDFASEAHRLIYRAMIQLQEEGFAIDLRSVQALLERNRELERAGGLSYLANLELDLPEPAHLDSYVEIVKERSIRRRLAELSRQILADTQDRGLDAAALLARAEEGILSLGEEAVRRGFQRIYRVLEETVSFLEESSGKGLTGLPTGFHDFDRLTHGLGRGQLIILAGRPGMGKTSLALNIAQHVAVRLGHAVGIFSLEMGQQELALRILSSLSDVSFSALRQGHLSQQKWKRVIAAMHDLQQAPLFIDDSASPTLLEVASKARRLKAEHRLELLVIDYLQLMQAGGRYENRNLEIAAITRSMKQLAKELDIPILLLSQLSRMPERRGRDHRPQLSDLRESGAIEQDADLVVFVYRDEVYNEDAPKGVAELIIAKHRNGETGTVELAFQGDRTTFLNPAAPGYEELAP